MTLSTFLLYGVIPLLGVASVLALVRIARGPSLPDRVVALDLLVALGLGIIAAYAAATGQAVLLDIALVLSLVSFLGTVAFAYYLERGV